jgi:hypothetical protein
LELEVELEADADAGADLLLIHTARPLAVSLSAHDLVPRDGKGTILSDQLALLGKEIGREVRVTATLSASPSPLPEPKNP